MLSFGAAVLGRAHAIAFNVNLIHIQDTNVHIINIHLNIDEMKTVNNIMIMTYILYTNI